MKFINFSVDKKLPRKLIFKHIFYILFWILGLAIFLFRLDTLLFSSLHLASYNIGFIVPAIYLFVLFIWIKNQRWYYTVAFFFYPLLLIFWFIPKWILFYGKIYILLYYLNFLFKVIRNYKKNILIATVAMILVLLLSLENSLWLRGFSVLFFSYLYFLFFKLFLKEIFKPDSFFESSSKNKIEKFLSLDSGTTPSFITNLEVRKEDEKLEPEEKEMRIKERLINTNQVYEYLIQSLSGFRNERSYILFCIFQLFLYFFITVAYFSFLNYQVFHINSHQFLFSEFPSVFDFIYYTLKTITFSNIDFLKPTGDVARAIEIFSFLMLGIFLLVIVVSLLFSLQRHKLKDLMESGVKSLKVQNELLSEHIEKKYGGITQNEENGFVIWIKNVFGHIF